MTEPTNPENVQATAEPKEAMTFESYRAKMAEILANPETTSKEIDALNAEWNKSKSERRKAEVEAERK